MDPIAESFSVVVNPVVRSQIYHLLALGFKYPTREMFVLYQDGNFMAELFELFSSLPHLSGIALQAAGAGDQAHPDLEGVDYRDFEVKYVGAFDVGFPEPPCPPYEGFYNSGVSKTEVMLDVSAFYRHFGLVMSQEEGKRELSDYLCAELEFLHFLTFKEAQARDENEQELLKGYILAQKDFLERHMITWLPKFCDKVQAEEGLPFYPRLALVTQTFINSDYEMVSEAVKEFEAKGAA
jgi:DMSO reductase family type II enzyme chaperone